MGKKTFGFDHMGIGRRNVRSVIPAERGFRAVYQNGDHEPHSRDVIAWAFVDVENEDYGVNHDETVPGQLLGSMQGMVGIVLRDGILRFADEIGPAETIVLCGYVGPTDHPLEIADVAMGGVMRRNWYEPGGADYTAQSAGRRA